MSIIEFQIFTEYEVVEEKFKALEKLGRKVGETAEDAEKKKIENSLVELRGSLLRLKRKISKECLRRNGRPSNCSDDGRFGQNAVQTGGLSTKEASLSDQNFVSGRVESGVSNTICGGLWLSDDSEDNDVSVDNVEHQGLKDSSDGSQYGSDSGMGDSLMNTLTTEFTDGLTKSSVVPSVHYMAEAEELMVAQGHGRRDGQTWPYGSDAGRRNQKDRETVTPRAYLALSRPTEGSGTSSVETVDKIEVEDHVDPYDILDRKKELRSGHPSAFKETADNMKLTSTSGDFLPEIKFSDINSLDAKIYISSPRVQRVEGVNSELPDQDNAAVKVTHDHDVHKESTLRQLAVQKVHNDEYEVPDETQIILGGNSVERSVASFAQPPMETIEEFVEEPEVLFQRLVKVEVMMKSEENENDTLKSALLKHVVR